MRLAIDGIDGVDEDIGIGEQVVEDVCILRRVAFREHCDLCVRDDFQQLVAQHFHFGPSDSVRTGLSLPVDVRRRNGIIVDQREVADAGTQQGFGAPAANAADAEHGDMHGIQPREGGIAQKGAGAFKSFLCHRAVLYHGIM